MHAPINIFEASTYPVVVNWTPTNPCEPTIALPGTREKIVVLADRLRRGQPLWHEDDPTVITSPGEPRVPTIFSIVATSFLANTGLAHG